ERGDTVAVEKPFVWDGVKYWVSVEGKVIPQKGAMMMGGGSEWHGIDLNDSIPLPFGWITPEKANVYDAPPEKPSSKATPVQLERRTRVQIIGEQMVGKRNWLKVTLAQAAPAPTFGDIIADNAKNASKQIAAPSPAPLPAEMWISA